MTPPPPPPDWLGLLADEERIPPDGPAAVDRAHALLDDAGHDPDDPEPLFVAANLLALVHFRQGRLDLARTVCRAETSYAARRSADPRCAALALQPQINLLRVEGYAGDLDRALDGLAALERIADGHPVRTPDIRWRPVDVDGDPGLARRVRALARNVRVADTCRILHRRGRTDLLGPAAARLTARWPALAAQGVQHAAETPWLLGAHDADPTDDTGLHEQRHQLRRLAVVRRLHLAARAAADGLPDRAAELADPLAEVIDALPGPWASPLTLPRWRAVLGVTLRHAGRPAAGDGLTRAALADAVAGGDRPLARGLRLHLGEPEPPAPARAPDAGARLDAATGRVLTALAADRHRAGV